MAVYVLLDETRSCCKIGFSKDYAQAQKRIKGLQTASPFKLEILAVNPYLEMEDEQRLHKKLLRFATGGGREWFDYRQVEVLEAVDYVSTAVVFRDDPKEFEIELPCQEPGSVLDRVVEEYVAEYGQLDDDFDLEQCKSRFIESLQQILNDAVHHGLDAYFCDDLGEYDIDDFLTMVIDFPHLENKGLNSGLGYYLGLKDPETLKHLSSGGLFDFLMEGHSGFEEKATAAVLALRLTSDIWVEDMDDPVTPDVFLYRGMVLVVYGIEFKDGMQQAEWTYSSLFWDVDEFGSQLFVFCVNSARECKEVPYGLGWRYDKENQ